MSRLKKKKKRDRRIHRTKRIKSLGAVLPYPLRTFSREKRGGGNKNGKNPALKEGISIEASKPRVEGQGPLHIVTYTTTFHIR